VRRHDHQPLDALGRMAAELLLVIADRLAVRDAAARSGRRRWKRSLE
jgi:hypothetical protein